MPTAIRPRRSALYMPGSNTRALEKGRSLPADMLILDLEDSVLPDRKEEARQNILTALKQGGYGAREILIRTNHLDSEWGEDDLRKMATSGAAGLLMPKTEAPQTLLKALEIMAEAGAPEDMRLWFMIETPMGVLRAEEISACSDRLGGIVMGTEDFTKELRCLKTPDREPYLYALSRSILVARAYGLAILDGPFADLNDMEGFQANCQQSREWGFDGKSLIHPKTIEAANKAFGPSEEDILHANRLIEASEQAAAIGNAVTLLDGKLVENLHVAEAKNLLEMARLAIEIAEQSE